MNNSKKISLEQTTSVTDEIEKLKAERRKIRSKIQMIRAKKQKRLPISIQAEYMDAIDFAKQWAYENKLIKKPTYWAFCKFAIINTTKIILEQAKNDHVEPNTHEQPTISQQNITGSNNPNNQNITVSNNRYRRPPIL